MKRTLALRVYIPPAYTTVLDGTSGNAVKLLYAHIAAGEFVKGAAVPGEEFTHTGNGVWEREIDSALLRADRTDYYYVQYFPAGGAWTDVAGFDPFFFNTKIIDGVVPINPDIQPLIPNACTAAETEMSLAVTLPSTYTSGAAINPSHTRTLIYVTSSDRSTWSAETEITTNTNTLSIERNAAIFSSTKYIRISSTVYDPITGQTSKPSAELEYQFVKASVWQTLTTAVTAPAVMAAGDAVESDLYGIGDCISVRMPSVTKGMSSELAIQFGGTVPTISAGALVGFTGAFVAATNTTLIIPKPTSFLSAVTVYMARRIVGYDEASDWIGSSTTVMYALAGVTPANKLSLLSTDIMDAIVAYTAAKLETAGGETLGVKP